MKNDIVACHHSLIYTTACNVPFKTHQCFNASKSYAIKRNRAFAPTHCETSSQRIFSRRRHTIHINLVWNMVAIEHCHLGHAWHVWLCESGARFIVSIFELLWRLVLLTSIKLEGNYLLFWVNIRHSSNYHLIVEYVFGSWRCSIHYFDYMWYWYCYECCLIPLIILVWERVRTIQFDFVIAFND